MTRVVDDARLMAYLDGELSEAESIAVEQALAASSELREREGELRQLLGDLVFDFAQLDALDAKALARIADANALPRQSDAADDAESRGSMNGSSGRPEPLQFAAPSAPSLEGRSVQKVSRPWSRTMGWLAAAGLLLAAGAGGGWWFAGSDRAGTDVQVAAGENGANGDIGVGSGRLSTQRPDRSVATQPDGRASSSAAPSNPSSSGASERPTRLAGTDDSLLNSAQSVNAEPTVAIRLAGSDPVSGRESATSDAGGVRNFVIDGVRIAVAFGSQVPDSMSVLDASGLTRLRDRASASNAGTGGARALGDRTGAPRDSLCPAGIKFVDQATGLPLSIRGPASCALLARLALQVQVQGRP